MESIFHIWRRDIMRYFRDRAHFIGSFGMPFMFLILFGNGMAGAMRGLIDSGNAPVALHGFDFVKFMFPGIVGMTVFNSAIFAALSIVQDREFGFLKEILVSPVPRASVALGKTLGGASVAFIQGLMMFVFVPFSHLKMTPSIIFQIGPAIFLVAFTISAIGIFIASWLKSSQGFQTIVQLLVFPMLFLSGAYFPLTGMPKWMNFVVMINPLTYAVDLFKKILLDYNHMPEILRQAMGLNIKVCGHLLTVRDEVMMITLFGVLTMSLAVWSFTNAEQ